MEQIALTMLNCYNDIDFYISGIETYIVRTAVYSYCGASMAKHKTTLRQTADILAMIEKKDDLLILKRLIESSLQRLTDSQRLLIKKAFFEKISKDELTQTLSLTKRTLYRRLHSTVNSFAKSLALEDFEQEWFYENCLAQNWIKTIYTKAKLIA